MSSVTEKPYAVYWNPGRNVPKYWVIAQALHVDAEAAMCALADALEPDVQASFGPPEWRQERVWLEVKWLCNRLCLGTNRTHVL